MQKSKASQFESALLARDDGDADAGRRGRDHAAPNRPRSPSSRATTWRRVDDIDLTAGKLAMVFAMLGAEGSFGVKSSADRLLPDLLAPGG